MVIYADEIKLHRRQLHLETNKPINVQMTELLMTELIISVNNSTRFHRETERMVGFYYNIQPKMSLMLWESFNRVFKCFEDEE